MPHDTLLLPTKLHPPARQAGSLLRARLVDALMERSSHKLQLLIAPAGYGKTTLLTDFATDAPFPLTWLTLDPADRDPHSFIEYLVAALRTQFPACGESTLRVLAGTPDIAARSAALARTLAADVYANVPALCLLVLDDFQEVNDSAVVTGFLDELLRLLPENLRLLISSRTYPNLSVFSRLAVEQQLTGLGEADLRFTGEEVRALFQSRYEKELTGKQAEELADRSEGWIAGLLLSAHGVWDGLLERVIETRGEGGPVYDYLADAAYTRQPPGLRAFLLASSVTRTVDVSICAALLGPGRWLDSLEEAERANLFLSRLPGAPPSFRYHQLFREFLQSRLHREQPEEYRRLHMAAAELMAARSDWPLALEHYQAAAAHAEAAALIGRIAPRLAQEGRWYLLARSIDALPEQVRVERPELLVARARAAALTDDLKTACSSASLAIELLASSEDKQVRAQAFQVLGNALRLSGRTQDAVTALRSAQELDPGSPEIQAATSRDLGLCLAVKGDFEGAVEHLTEALSQFEQLGAVHQAARTEVGLGIAYGRLGRPHDAAAFYQRALDRWQRAGEDADDVAIVLNNLGFLRYLQGEPEAAQQLFEEGIRIAQATGNLRGGAGLEASIGGLLLAGGDREGGEASYQRALTSAEDVGELWTITVACEGLGLCALKAGALKAAGSWFDRAESLAERQQSPYLSALVQTDRALLELTREQPAASLHFLHDAEAVFHRQDTIRDLIKLNVIRAFALERSGDHISARARFRDALRGAEQLGLPGLIDLPASFDVSVFTSLEAAEYGHVQEGVLRRISAGRRAGAVQPPSTEAPPPPTLRIRSFGRGVVWTESGEAVDWGREKARELFFYLLFDGPVSAGRVMADLWPESSGARARAGFDSAVYAVRRRLHPDVIRSEHRQYVLSPGESVVHDAADFDVLVEQAEKASDPGERAAPLEEAVRLYAAPLLQETSGAWAEVLRLRYETKALAAFLSLARSYAERGAWRESLATAHRALEIQPSEELYAVAVRASIRLQDLSGAQRLLRQWRQYAQIDSGQRDGLFETLAREASRLARSSA